MPERRASAGRAALAVPVAVAVAVVSGLVPAWLAARADPVASTRPPVLAARRGHHPGGITTMAILNVTRIPGAALLPARMLRRLPAAHLLAEE
jgi:putative ABC transport system permease protein